MGDTFPSHNSNSSYRNPTFYYVRYVGPSGLTRGAEVPNPEEASPKKAFPEPTLNPKPQALNYGR